ncbi:GNAT family N-acetyltransferase [Paenibacillus sp. y28]|uniref:GNAT family N-acetyltransferase n=1 Tax=Paenibacillus sp. y28 TaxID=3129110 RepID=UPI003017E3D0
MARSMDEGEGWAEFYLKDFIHTPGFKGVVAEKDSVIHGFIFGASRQWWKGTEFFIHEMCVRADTERTGIGTNMFAYLDQILAEEGIQNIALLTSRGIPAEQFYLKNGFQEIDNIVFMAKRLK